MSQYDSIVEKQRLLLEAEEWSTKVKLIHAHSVGSMWYDDTNNTEKVIDLEYWNGTVLREIISTGEKKWFGEQLVGEELVDAYQRNS
jgi:hypothetical protein